MAEKPEFLKVAVAHGLLTEETAEEIRAHAAEKKVDPSDAALSMSAMASWEVDATQLLMAPRELAPGFELIRLIGCGAAGMVFRARQQQLNRDVALKTINVLGRTTGSNEARINQEAQAIARLQHPNIVAAYDSGFYNGRFCIAMELVEGQSLQVYLEEHAPLSELMAWRLVRQAAAGLSHAGSQGIVHRDIKPANLLLSGVLSGAAGNPDLPFVKIVDFGLALDEFRNEDERLTVTGATLGTPAYVAPEQLQDTTVDGRADIYSLGATMFHMLTGKPPFFGQSPMKAILQKTIGNDSWRDALPESITDDSRQLILDMTAAEPADRLEDYQTLLGRIDSVLSDLESAATQPTFKPPSFRSVVRRIRRRAKSRVIGLTALGLLALLAATFPFWPGSRDHDNHEPEEQISWQQDGLRTRLFDGVNLERRSVEQSGTWQPGEAIDGSPLIFGTENCALTFPLKMPDASNVSLVLRVHLTTEMSAAEIIVANRTSPKTRDELGAVMYHYSGAEFRAATDTAASPQKSVQLPPVAPEEVILRPVEVRREGRAIRVEVKGIELARFQALPDQQYEVIVRCHKERIGLGDISIAKLKPVQ